PQKAVEIANQADLGDEARGLLRDDLTADAYVARLRERGLWADAIRFLAHRLPKREAVWWGCLCAWKVSRPNPPEKEAAGLQAAVRWVREPTEDNRRTAEAAGTAAGGGPVRGGRGRA